MQAFCRAFAVIEFAPDGTVLDLNANFERVSGYRKAELIGRHHRVLLTPDEAAALEQTAADHDNGAQGGRNRCRERDQGPDWRVGRTGGGGGESGGGRPGDA